MSFLLFAQNALCVLAIVTPLWLVSVRLKNVTIVDPFWSILFLAITADTVVTTGAGPRKLLLLAMVGLWAIRLWLHLLLRSWGKPEDPRYQAFRQRYGPERYWWFSFFQVFLLQGLLALVISVPLQYAASRPPSEAFRGMDALALLLFGAGFMMEAVADWQLQRFRKDPEKRGTVLDSGLFAWTRHPNYFGDALVWWGFGVFAVDMGPGLLTILGPALMTFLLMRVSGVTMLDQHLSRTRPGYSDYIARTSGFFPRWPRK